MKLMCFPRTLQHRLYALCSLTALVPLTSCAAQTEVPRVLRTSANARLSVNARPAAHRTALDDYIARPEKAFSWREVKNENADAPRTIELTSQTWQGTTWTHRLRIYQPANNEFPGTAILIIGGGGKDFNAGDDLLGQIAANATGAVCVHLIGIPNQPLWEMREDALISHTFQRYLETGDATWPLLLPMTKSVVKAMDAVSEYSAKSGKAPLKRFVLTGGSKRGWTTWLAGAADKRVIAIAPMVYDNLNLQKQMARQLETWGEYSVMIRDYTERGLQGLLSTPRGRELSRTVDPWEYRDRLLMPKLIVNGSNDPYWTLGALDVYRGDLRGQTSVLYSMNAGHNLGVPLALGKVFGSVGGWFRRVASGKTMPSVRLRKDLSTQPGGATRFVLSTDATRRGEKLQSVQLWLARSATRDFRAARWTALPMTTRMDGTFTADVPASENGALKYAAVIGEVTLQPTARVPQETALSTSVIEWQSAS